MGSFRVFVERQRADPIAAEPLSVASSAIRLRALSLSPLLPITIAPHHHENIRFRAARHLRYVVLGQSRRISTGATLPYSIALCARACDMISAKRPGDVPGGAKPRYLPSGPTRKMKLLWSTSVPAFRVGSDLA